jgi:enoyl-CoA hydratase/carnithine racemase
MELILTGQRINAREAERIGLIAAIFPVDRLVHEAIKVAEKIASHSNITVQLAKEAINAGKSCLFYNDIERITMDFFNVFVLSSI